MSRTSPSLSTARQTYNCLPLMETNTSSRCHRPSGPKPSSSQLARNDPAELQSPAADRLVRHIDATLGEHVLDVAVAQSEAEIEPDGLLDDDARKAVAAV